MRRLIPRSLAARITAVAAGVVGLALLLGGVGGAPGSGGDGAVHQRLQPVFPLQRRQRRGGGAAGAGDVGAKNLDGEWGARKKRAGASNRFACQLHRRLAGQAGLLASARQAFGKQENIGRATAGNGGDRIHQVFVLDP